MQRLMKFCARGALGLGTAAFLLAGVPAHADPASGAASRHNQPGLLAQSPAQPQTAEQLQKNRQQEQQKREKMQQQGQQQGQPQKQPAMRRMRGAMPEASREAAPPQPGAKRFGAGVIRHSDPGEVGAE